MCLYIIFHLNLLFLGVFTVHHTNRRSWIIFTSDLKFNLLKNYSAEIKIRSKNIFKISLKILKQVGPKL